VHFLDSIKILSLSLLYTPRKQFSMQRPQSMQWSRSMLTINFEDSFSRVIGLTSLLWFGFVKFAGTKHFKGITLNGKTH
jgi:hypothetical protein